MKIKEITINKTDYMDILLIGCVGFVSIMIYLTYEN